MKRPYRLSAKFVEGVKEPGRYGDGRGGNGLSMLVKEGREQVLKSWCQRLPKGTKGKREIGLGRYPQIVLSEARDLAMRNWLKAIDGGIIVEQIEAKTPIFADALEQVIALQSESWKKGGKTSQSWRATMDTYVLPTIGHKPVDQISSADVMDILQPIWGQKTDISKAVKRRIGTVMDWTIAQGYRETNPVSSIDAALPKNGHKIENLPALPFNEVAGALATIRSTGAHWATILCLEFQTLTGARPSEAREAVWSEIDGDVWAIPTDRTKMERVHRIPLSPAALDVVEKAREATGGTGLVFPSLRGKALTDSTVSKLLRENGIGCVPHGMRSSLRDFLAEKTDAPREIAEHCLGHVEGSQSELAYRRTDYFDKRRALMEAWGEYLKTAS